HLSCRDGGFPGGACAPAAHSAAAGLSPVRGPANPVRYPEFLERHLQSSVRRDRRSRSMALSRRSRRYGHLRGNLPDWFRVVLLSLESERRHAVLGPFADDADILGYLSGGGWRADRREGWCAPALATAGARRA